MEHTRTQEIKDLHHYWALRMCILLALEPRKLFCLYYSWDQTLGDQDGLFSVDSERETLATSVGGA